MSADERFPRIAYKSVSTAAAFRLLYRRGAVAYSGKQANGPPDVTNKRSATNEEYGTCSDPPQE